MIVLRLVGITRSKVPRQAFSQSAASPHICGTAVSTRCLIALLNPEHLRNEYLLLTNLCVEQPLTLHRLYPELRHRQLDLFPNIDRQSPG